MEKNTRPRQYARPRDTTVQRPRSSCRPIPPIRSGPGPVCTPLYLRTHSANARPSVRPSVLPAHSTPAAVGNPFQPSSGRPGYGQPCFHDFVIADIGDGRFVYEGKDCHPISTCSAVVLFVVFLLLGTVRLVFGLLACAAVFVLRLALVARLRVALLLESAVAT